ncbi:Sensory transduction protein kinase AlgZ [Alkalilimnicola ehrlichii MLHE-1]|uniref:Sensory transduction protein kinase AlgZ n=1 Tax=Alkalilimnicola ehrlichii (strain ATCC BAA-1101 / DSM 17681 / MLHE-1) TaxID=187272 RepID=Q0A575_ALKEH|nr:Sensory transduction protein kinase AlgZ [Alkalilimnicola ehrlichii MLHE-1]
MAVFERGGSSVRRSAILPDFCHLQTVLAVVLAGQLLAFVLFLARPATQWDWATLGLISLYVQWVVLLSTALLCLSRRPLSRVSPEAAGLLAWLGIIAVAAVTAELAWRSTGGVLGAERWALVLRSVAISGIIAALVLRYLYLQGEWRRGLQAEARASMQALQSRIRPHFLFNTLNTIAAMLRQAPERAEQALLDLADLFRAGLREVGGWSTLDEERALTERYLRLEQLRLQERLRLDCDWDGLPGQARVPSLILQPLAENAVVHGIEQLPAGGELRLRGRREGDTLVLELENPVPAGGSLRGGHGLGLESVRRRMRYAFGAAADLEVTERAGRFHVVLRWPWQEAG